jgi:hypothetical protein
MLIRWSVGIEAQGDRVMKLEEVAIAKGKEHFVSAVEKAGLPIYPIVRVEAMSEDEDEADDL